MIVVSGKARARSTRSGSCGWKCQESNVSPSLPSSAKPSRNFGSSKRGGDTTGGGGGPVAHAAEGAAADGDLGFQHGAHPGAQHEVDPADDRLADARLAVLAR